MHYSKISPPNESFQYEPETKKRKSNKINQNCFSQIVKKNSIRKILNILAIFRIKVSKIE